jgi:hypothetical protein
MIDASLKVCPKCLMLAEVAALRCTGCNHLFRARSGRPNLPETARPSQSEREWRKAPLLLKALGGMMPLVLIWAMVRTGALLLIAGLLAAATACAGSLDCTGLSVTCATVGLCTGVGALCSAADFLTTLKLLAEIARTA